LKDVEQAREKIQRFIWRTPLIESERLSQKTGSKLFLKLENLQKTGAFKIRGVLNKVLSLKERERKSGLLCATSGSHGLAVGQAAEITGTQAVAVVPVVTPEVKLKRLRERLKVVIYGETYQESFLYARQVAEREGMVFIHGFDDPLIISGQGTVALEIMEELPETGLIVVPVGGGGLVAGVLAAVKERHPRVKVVGVQASGAPSMYRSWQTGQVFEIAQIKTMAEGIAVKKPGQLTFELVRRWIDDIVLVTEEEIREGMLTLLRDGRVLAEAAGAVSVAAFLARKIKAAEKTVCVVSGGNVELKNLLKPGEEEDGHKN